MSDLSVADLQAETPPAVGLVWERERGSLPYDVIHGEPLVRCAVLALEAAQIEPVDPDWPWPSLQERVAEHAEALVLHDALCPLVPPDFLARCVTRAVTHGRIVVAYRPVTDTVKRMNDDRVGETLDRDQLRAVAAPIVLPAAVVASLTQTPGPDAVEAVAMLSRVDEIDWVEAPPHARRLGSRDDIRLLEALTAPTAY